MQDCSNISESKLTVDIYFVMSMDGIVALDHDRDIREYSSAEDRAFFINSLNNYDAVIVSSRTYVNDAPASIKRIILTHHRKEDGNPQNIYMSGDIRKICDDIYSVGIRRAALAAGPTTCLSFIKEGLIDHLYLSIEPVTLGEGIHLFADEPYKCGWKLTDIKRLNSRGTIMACYEFREFKEAAP